MWPRVKSQEPDIDADTTTLSDKNIPSGMAEDVAMADLDGIEDSQFQASQRPPVKLLVEEELDEKYLCNTLNCLA